MAGKVEYVHYAFPYRRLAVTLSDRHGLGKRGYTTMLGFDGSL
jgi:hypothetical protein